MAVTVADPLWAYIPRDRRRALAAGEELPARAHGAALFVDISGFTPLTEGLADELGSHRASEFLTASLNHVFQALIDELHGRGGDVIYFSGDAITCWLEGDDGLRAVATALAMQDAIAREGLVVTPAGKRFQLELKAAVTAGTARRGVVGDPAIQLVDVLAGSIVDSLAELEHACERGEVVVGATAAAALRGRVELGEARPISDGVAAVVTAFADAVPFVPPFADDALPEELSRPWLLPEVQARLSTGRGEFLSELRPAVPVFVNFGGIDYDEDEDAIAKLDEFVCGAQRIFAAYGGNVVTITIGDKGAYLFGVFGAPVAHEDDAPRACSAALELVRLEETTFARSIRVGISQGRLLTGTYGHAARRAFGSLGDDVNLSARLMTEAPPGQIFVSERVKTLAGAGFTWLELEPLTLKGKSRPERAFGLTGTTGPRSRRSVRYTLPIVGRSAELGRLRRALVDAGAGRGRVVGISAEAGIGKSRLVAEFLRGVGATGASSAVGECQSFGTTSSYAVWEPIWRRLLDVPETLSEAEQVQALERALAEHVDAALVPRAPLFGEVLDISIPDTELTASLDPKLRKTSLESLLADCFLALAKNKTLVLVLEDCHWLDPLSRDLLEVLARVMRDSRVLVVLAYRPDAAAAEGLDLARLPNIEQLELDALADAAMTQVVETKVVQLFGDEAEAPDLLLELVVSRAQGNPFYAEEILNFLHERGVPVDDEHALRGLELPGSLHSLVLSRIDTLVEEPRRTLKVASVGGRTFRAPTLPGVYPELGSLDEVRGHLAALHVHDLVNSDREEDESYLFKHAITQEVAYESTPFALRADLHGRYGRYLEDTDGGLDLLAHHFWHGDDEERKRRYLRLAGDAAQSAYANEVAIDYYERLVPLVAADEERAEVLLELGKVLELVGRWDDARAVASEAVGLARDDGERARAEIALAEIARKQGAYAEAAERLARARAAFELTGEEQGLGQVLHLEGTLATQQGQLAEARARYEESLAIRRRFGDRKQAASVLSNLGVVAEYEGDYDRSRALHEEALGLRSELGDRWAIAVSETNLGMIALLQERHDEAHDRFEEAMRLNAEVGDGWMVAISHNNLGNALRNLGDSDRARGHYARALRAFRDWDDRWALGFLLEDVSILLALEGSAEDAFALLGAADTLRAEIGSPRGDTLEAEIERRLAQAKDALGAEAAASARRRGAAGTLGEVLDAAEASLAPTGD